MIILAYPICLIVLSTFLNVVALGVEPNVIALPADKSIFAMTVAAILLVLNHTWLMTSTELVRLNHNIQPTPEEWDSRGLKKEDVLPIGWNELERRHNAHRNTTENTVYFAVLATVFCFVSPPDLTAQIWIIGYAIARLGYTYGYLSRRTGLRGLFMSLNLLALYGLASYLAFSLML